MNRTFSKCCLAAVLVSLLLSPHGGARTFTDATGRTIDADLVAHIGDSITLRRGTQDFTLPIAKFSEEDQAYIREWIGANPDKGGYRFRVVVDLDEDYTGRGYGDGIWYEDKLKFRPHNYNVLISNLTEASIDGLEVRYEIYINDVVVMKGNQYGRLATGTEKSDKLEAIAGKLSDKVMAPKGRIEFERSFVIQDYVDRDGGKVDQAAADKVLGIGVRVYKGGAMIYEFIDGIDDGRMKTVNWQNQSGEETEELKK